jgi:protease I
MKSILMVLASERFRDIEYLVPRAFFEQAGYNVSTASSAKESRGRFGYRVNNDFLISEVEVKNFDAIYLVGGAGSLEYINNETAQSLVERFYNSEKVVGAICAAPQNLLHWGMLKGKNATGFNSSNNEFVNLAIEKGAVPFADQKVVVDGRILTANGPEASEESALEFIKLMESVSL